MNQLSFLAVPVDTWLVALVETSLRLSVILVVAGAIAMVLRRSSANLRHLVWAFALGGALVLPIGASYLPALNLPMPTPFVELAWSADAAVAERLSQTRISAESATGLPVRVVGRDVEIGNVPTAVSAGAAALAHASVVSAEADSPVVVATEAGPGVDQSAPSRTGGPGRGSGSSSGSGWLVWWLCSSESAWASRPRGASASAPNVRVTVSGRDWRRSSLTGSG